MARPHTLWLLSSLCSLCLCGEFFAADAPKPPAKLTFDDNVLPLLKDKCAACHNPDKKRGGVVLNNFTRIMEGGSSGALVKPGDPENSAIFQVMAHKREPFMPPSSPQLPDETVNLLRQWIADGALENSGARQLPQGRRWMCPCPAWFAASRKGRRRCRPRR